MRQYDSKSPAISQLIKGYQQFQRCPNEVAAAATLAQGQSPKVMVIACADSRVDPSVIFNSARGELFIVRNVANLVPHYDADPKHHSTHAALEFAVKGLGVTDIVVLGHSQCGGIKTLMAPESPFEFVRSWMEVAAPAKQQVQQNHSSDSSEQQQCACERAALRLSLSNLRSFPWIQSRIDEGSLNVHAWHFDIATNQISGYQASEQQFVVLDDAE